MPMGKRSPFEGHCQVLPTAREKAAFSGAGTNAPGVLGELWRSAKRRLAQIKTLEWSSNCEYLQPECPLAIAASSGVLY